MASCSVPSLKKYDVFLSFRGVDTRDTFTSHLYAALCRKKIETYIDDRLERGDKISPALMEAIEESDVSVVIFSENYASSSWCLDEPVHILYCRENNKQVVIPVFYHIDPSHVRKQKGSYAVAFTELEERFEDRMDKVLEWKAALNVAANLSGFDSRVTRPDAKLVEEIVEDILKKLNHLSSSDDLKGLVGIEKHIERIESLLCIDSLEIRTIVIWGMGGIGKTTLAGAMYNRISSQFDGCSFLANVREETERHGLISLRNKLLAELLDEKSLNIRTPSLGSSFVTKRLRSKKFLVVLDDVNSPSQLKCLVGEHGQFGAGSRIIVTTRDVQVLRKGANEIYKLEGLDFDEAFQLFSVNAFEEDSPPEDYLELSKRVVKYANGVPLALVVLGSHLLGRSKEAWESAMAKLTQIPHGEIQNVLKISYDGLELDQKEIFLDIACFYKGKSVKFLERLLDGCGFSAKIEIDTFIKKSLIVIINKKIWMHDLLENMGREIVRQESTDVPGNRSRLWIAKDVYDVLRTNSGTEAIKGIFLNMSEIEEVQVSPMAFTKMQKLRLLKIYTSESVDNCKLHLGEVLQSLPYSLRYVHWHGYPLKSLPPNFNPENLVELNMPYSKLDKLWNGVQHLACLRKISLSYSRQLTEIPDLSKARNLQYVNLQSCTCLPEVPSYFQNLDKLTTLNLTGCQRLKNIPELKGDMEYLHLSQTMVEELPSSIGCLDKLVSLTLDDCEGLKNLPSSTCMLKSLQYLILSGCSSFNKFPELPKNIRELNLSDTLIDLIPSSIEGLVHLRKLSLEDCTMLECLPPSIYKLKSLEYLSLSGCSSLETFPEISEPMERLELLNLTGTAIKELPLLIDNLIGLQILYLQSCENLEKLPSLSGGLRSLSILELSYCNLLELPDQLGCLSSLQRLDISGNAFHRIPTCKQLSKLNYLKIGNCKSLQFLPELPSSLEFLDAHGCTSLEVVSSSGPALKQGWDQFQVSKEQLIFFNCVKLDENARINILTDSHIRILRMSTILAWSGDGYPHDYSISVCCPGNEVQKWFSYQSAGPSINIKLPPHWHNSDFLGFALCVVAALEDYRSAGDLSFQCHSYFKSHDGENRELESHLRGWGWYNEDDKTRTLNSDYMFLWYDYRIKCRATEDTFTEVSFDFHPIDAFKRPINSCKVKKCGIRLLYVQDAFSLFNEDVGEPESEGGNETRGYCGESQSIGSGSSSCCKEEEEELHAKQI